MPNIKYKLMLALISAEVLSTFEVSMAFAAIRFMIEDFGSPEAVGWTITAFLLSGAVSAAIFGKLGDMLGRRTILLTVIALTVFGSLLASFFPVFIGVLFGRIIQGAAGGIFPLCTGILREQVSRAHLPMYLGALTAILTVSGGLGLLVGGVVVDYLTWHWIFYINAVVGLVAWLLVYKLVPHSTGHGFVAGTNYIYGLFFVPAIVLTMLAIRKSIDWGWTDIKVIGLAAGGALCLAIWAISELNSKVPLIQIRLLKNKQVLLVIFCAALLGLTWNQFQQIWSVYLQQPQETGAGLGLSATMSGFVLQPQTVAAFLGGPIAGWLVIRKGIKISMATGTLILSGCWFAATYNHNSLSFIVLLMVLMGISSAFLYAMLPIIITNVVEEHRTSEVTGVMTVIRGTATGIGTQIVAFILNYSTVELPSTGSKFPSDYSYSLAMGYVGVGVFIIFLSYVILAPSVSKNGCAELHQMDLSKRRE